MLLLTEDEVRHLLTMDMALAAVEEGLRKMALDEVQNVPRARSQTDHGMLHVLSASARLEMVSRHRTQPHVDGILLMAESCVLGPKWQNHVVCR